MKTNDLKKKTKIFLDYYISHEFILNPHNGTSLTGVIDLTAHSISLFQENKSAQDIKDTFMNQKNSIAEPYDVQIDELGDNIIQMYQFIGDINDKSGWIRIIIKLYD